MRVNCDSMDNSVRFGRLNIGVSPKKALNQVTDRDGYSMQVIFKDTPAEQDAVYLNGKKLGRLSLLNQAKDEATTASVLSQLSNDTVQINTREADPSASFKTAFPGFTGFFRGLVQSSPAMTVKDVWNSRKDDILLRARVASYAGPLGFDRVINKNQVSFNQLNRTDMNNQWDAVGNRYNQFIVT